MSLTLSKIAAAQRLLGEACDLLRREEQAESLRRKSEVRLETMPKASADSHSRTSDLQTLLQQNQKFGTIYADPPWQYTNAASRGAAENHYSTINTRVTLPVCPSPNSPPTRHTYICGRPTLFCSRPSTSSRLGDSSTRVAWSGSNRNSATATIGVSVTNSCCWAFAAN